MLKQRFFFLALVALGFTFLACDEPDPEQEQPGVTEATYSGTLSVDQLDSTFYVTENVLVSVKPVEASNSLRLVMHQVRFSPRMPLSLDMTIEGLTFVTDMDGGFNLSGDSLVPLAMGGAFPAYLIKNLTGHLSDNVLNLSLTCGQYPMTYSGSRKD